MDLNNYLEQRMAIPNMDICYMQLANQMNYMESIQRIYPDAYKRMMPYVDRAMHEVDDPSSLTEEDMSRITHEIVHRSSILDDPPNGHNEATLRDLAGVMLLAGLFDDNDRPLVSPYALPFFLPYGRGRRSRIIY